MVGVYDRNGTPISLERYSELLQDLAYRHVRVTAIGDDVEVSTVWLGIDHNFTRVGPPLIFETLVFGGALDGQGERWPNEDAAFAGHDQWVARVREGVGHGQERTE
jgi:hypothetical protein